MYFYALRHSRNPCVIKLFSHHITQTSKNNGQLFPHAEDNTGRDMRGKSNAWEKLLMLLQVHSTFKVLQSSAKLERVTAVKPLFLSLHHSTQTGARDYVHRCWISRWLSTLTCASAAWTCCEVCINSEIMKGKIDTEREKRESQVQVLRVITTFR